MNGNTGRIADINLTTGTVEMLQLSEETYRDFIGGSGLAAKVFWDRADFSADALSPEALFILMNGPLTGIRLSGASRMNATARSPLTGGIAESSCGGYFPPALRLAGYDGLIVTGKAVRPSVVVIDKGTLSIEDAGSLWGKGIMESTADLREVYGKKSTSLVIGPAGESMVPLRLYPQRSPSCLRAMRHGRRHGIEEPEGPGGNIKNRGFLPRRSGAGKSPHQGAQPPHQGIHHFPGAP